METNYYDLLQVSPQADTTVIEAAYRGLRSKYEAAQATDPSATSLLIALNDAYTVLTDPQRRAEYDSNRLAHGVSSPSQAPAPLFRTETGPVAVIPPAPVGPPASVRTGLPIWLLGLLGLCALLLLGAVCAGGLLFTRLGGGAGLLFGEKATPTAATLRTATEASTQVPTGALATRTPSATGSFVTQVVMATDTRGDNFDPVGVTASFPPTAVLHAVVTIFNAPANSTVRVVWFADNVSGSSAANGKIDEYTLTTEGSRNLDFTLKPKSSWPDGSFHVDVYASGKLVQTVTFSVKGGSGSSTNSNSASGLVQSATFAHSVTPQVFDPVDPTATFSPSDVTLHLVIAIKNAPDNTAFKVTWFFGTQLIDSTTLNAGGSRNLDFTLKQNRPWPTGNYHVDIFVNGNPDQTTTFQVQ